MDRATRLLAALAALTIVSFATVSKADYVIDESQSSITLDIWALGILDISTPQLVGSDTATPTGTVGANRVGGLNGSLELTGGAFSFLNYAGGDLEPAEYADGASVTPAPQPPGQAPANYGFDINVLGGAILGQVAIRALNGELTSGVLTLTGGDYDATLVSLGIPTGHVDFSLVGPGLGTLVPPTDEAGGADIENLSAANAALIGTVGVAGLIETLIVPIDVEIVTELGGVEVSLFATGQIVATRTVPEPSAILLLGAGVAGVFVAGRRRWKR